MRAQIASSVGFNNYVPVIQQNQERASSGKALLPPTTNTQTNMFQVDQRNPGGRKVINNLHMQHSQALQNVSSVVAQQRKPPHAHINNVKGQKDKFGQDKQHFKRYRVSRKAIQNRPLVNIDQTLKQRPEFSEVKELRRKLKETRNRDSLFEQAKPKTLNLAKKLSQNRRNNDHEYNEHMLHLAALQRRLASASDFSQRSKNPYDPVAFPSLFFRREGQSTKNTSIIGFQKKIMRRAEKQRATCYALEMRIVDTRMGRRNSQNSETVPMMNTEMNQLLMNPTSVQQKDDPYIEGEPKNINIDEDDQTTAQQTKVNSQQQLTTQNSNVGMMGQQQAPSSAFGRFHNRTSASGHRSQPNSALKTYSRGFSAANARPRSTKNPGQQYKTNEFRILNRMRLNKNSTNPKMPIHMNLGNDDQIQQNEQQSTQPIMDDQGIEEGGVPHHSVMPVFIELCAEDKADLHKKLIDAICQYRLYTDMQLQALFQQAANQNANSETLDQQDVEEVCHQVQNELDEQQEV